MTLKPRTSKISTDFFYHLTSIQLLWMQLPALKTSRLPWCAVQTDAQPPMHANRKCGLGDGNESDPEWLEAETPRRVNMWTAASAGWAQINYHRLLLHLSLDWKSPPKKGRGPTYSVTGRWHGDIPGILGTLFGLAAQRSTPVWKVVNVEPKGRRESDAALSSHQLRHSSLLICKGRALWGCARGWNKSHSCYPHNVTNWEFALP